VALDPAISHGKKFSIDSSLGIPIFVSSENTLYVFVIVFIEHICLCVYIDVFNYIVK